MKIDRGKILIFSFYAIIMLGLTLIFNLETQANNRGTQVNNSEIICLRQPKPCITFTDDDSSKQFPGNWTPILKTYRIPVVCFIPTSYIDHGVTRTTIADMEALGVEYCSHTHSHINLTTMTEEQIISECETSQNLIRSIGGNPDVIGYPGGASNALVRDVCSRYFRAGFGGGDKTTSPNYNPSPLKQYDIKRIEMTPETIGDPRQLTEAECLAMIDELVDNKGWRIFTFHSQNPTFNEAMKTQIGHMIERAQAKGVEIVNMATALNYFGADGSIISADENNLSGSIYNFGTSITDFPKGKVTEVLITGATSRWGFPRCVDGKLITYRLEDTNGNLGKQEYRPNGYDDIWVRYADTNGNWLAFMPPPGLRGTTANRPTDAPANYCYYDTDLGKPIWATQAPARNIDKIVVTSGATGSGNITIRSTTVAITAGDTTEQVAAKIRVASIAGFSWGGYGTTCILLRYVPSTLSATTYTDTDSTGVTATVTRLITGIAPVWKDINGTVV